MQASEFDIENLKPTYKLLVGVPGKSNAFAITKRLGMPDSILTRAEELMNDEHISVEELIKNIYDDKVEIEKEKDKIRQNSNQIELLRKNIDNKNTQLSTKENDIIEKAKIQAREILLNAKKEANSIISSLNELYNNADAQALKKANSIRNKLNENIKNNNSSTTTNNLSEPSTTLENVTIGMTVLVKTLNQNGTVLTLPNKSNEVQVQIGSMKMTVKTDKLVAIKNNTQKSNNKQKSFSSRNFNNKLKSKTAVTEINVIGETVEEAIFVVDKFLDDSALANLSTVRIVHGKGTGKLRQGIHNFLKTNSHVKSFRLGTFGEGETGVTVVELK